MIVKIYRNTTTGIKLCEGEYFEHEGFRFCITTVEYEQKLVIYAIEYTTGFDAIPPGLNYILRPIKKNLKKDIKQVKQTIKGLSKDELTALVNKAKKSPYLKGNYPLNK